MSRDRQHYNRWHGMKRRCYNPSCKAYKYYGARGIKICDEWLDIKVFIEWCNKTYIENTSIDRIDNDGPYSPNNCRWATKSEQSKNRRFTDDAFKVCVNNGEIYKNICAKKYGDYKTRKEKHCNRCDRYHPIDEFHKNKSSRDGIDYACKPCVKLIKREYYIRKKQKLNPV